MSVSATCMFQLSETIVSLTNQEIIDYHPRTVQPRPEVVYFCRDIFFFFFSPMASLDDLLHEAAALSLTTPPPVGASVSFASPVASLASPTSMVGVVGPGGGSEGTSGDSKRMYSVVLVPGDDRSICFGLIGVGCASFCVRRNFAPSSPIMSIKFRR
jgi:hypothetical protein